MLACAQICLTPNKGTFMRARACSSQLRGKYNFPAAIGSPDCVHVRIRKLFPYDDVYINRKEQRHTQMYVQAAALVEIGNFENACHILTEFRGSYAHVCVYVCVYAYICIRTHTHTRID